MFAKLNKFYAGESILYFIAWMCVLAVPLMQWEFNSSSLPLEEMYVAWYRISPYLFLFLLNNFLFAPRFLMRKLYSRYVLYSLLTIAVTFSSIDLFQKLLDGVWGEMLPINRDWYGRITLTSLSYFWNCFFAMFMMTANSGIKLIYKSMRDDQKMAELKRYNLQIEMDYLKYQVNPHFFMNTLNNIHALIDIDGEEAKDALIGLSKMMRHVLYESGKNETSLAHEIEFGQNYVQLMRLRFDEHLKVRFVLDPKLDTKGSLPPLLLVVLVENAFKHGATVGQNCYINIVLKAAVKTKRLICRVSNSIADGEKRESGGLGLMNLNKRLNLLYGDNFSLTISKDARNYEIELNIPFE